jgi:hypothetical protein
MKALWLREVQAVLEREDFLKWWQSLVDLEQKLLAVWSRHDEFLAQVNLMDFRAEFTQKNAIDSLYLAGEYEDTAAQLLAEASEIENKSYEAAAHFESQRISASDVFSRMGAVENNFLSAQTEVRGLGDSIKSEKDRERGEELRNLLKKKEAEQMRLENEFREAAVLYERENSRKISLWEEVEQMWARSLERNLGVSERRVKSKRARREAERLFKEAEQHKRSSKTLQAEANEADQKKKDIQQAIEDLRTSSKRLFGCLIGEEFLYWPRRENINEVYCVPINDHAEDFNIELRAKNVYFISRQRGVEFIEPLPPTGEVPEEEDARIDDFFQRGRPEHTAP